MTRSIVSPMHLTLVTAALAGVLLLSAGARTARAEGPPAPPPEAYAACESKSSGDACSVALRDFTVTGTCAPDRESSRLFCRPDRPPPPPPDGQGPPR